MRFNEAFEQMVRAAGVTKTKVSLLAGKKNVSALLMMLKRNNPRVDQMMPYVESAGYSIVMVPSNRTQFLPDGCYVIDEPSERGE